MLVEGLLCVSKDLFPRIVVLLGLNKGRLQHKVVDIPMIDYDRSRTIDRGNTAADTISHGVLRLS